MDIRDRVYDVSSVGASMINVRVEECLSWVKWQPKGYLNHERLALDFGKRGTDKFFPLSLLVHHISIDKRFDKFLKGEGEIDGD